MTCRSHSLLSPVDQSARGIRQRKCFAIIKERCLCRAATPDDQPATSVRSHQQRIRPNIGSFPTHGAAGLNAMCDELAEHGACVDDMRHAGSRMKCANRARELSSA